MTTDVLGRLNFSEIPTVEGQNVMVDSGGVPSFSSGPTTGLPAAGTGPVGRIFLDTTSNKFFRDDGTVWVDLTPLLLLDGTAGQVEVADGTNATPSIVSLADNLALPGVQGFVPPRGTSAERAVSPRIGEQRFNTLLNRAEEFTGAYWQPAGGTVLQIVTGNIGALSGTTTVPLDNTVPTSTEGYKIWTTSFTPLSTTSKIVIQFSIIAASSGSNNTAICSVFSGTTNLGSKAVRIVTANTSTDISFYKVLNNTSTATITISARLGNVSAGTSYCNQVATSTLGGSLTSSFTITEIQ